MEGKRSFQEIYEKFHPGVLRFLSRLVGEEEAEDVAQEVFLRVDRGLEGFRGESSMGTWIYRIARNAFGADAGEIAEAIEMGKQVRKGAADKMDEFSAGSKDCGFIPPRWNKSACCG